MIKSMTGYGSAAFEDDDFKLAIEVKTLNSKFLDLSLKLPKGLQEFELEIKSLISDLLIRGKANVVIDYEEKKKAEANYTINPSLFDKYFKQLQVLKGSMQVSDDLLFRQALQMPEVIQFNDSNESDKISLAQILATVRKGLEACDHYRVKEGHGLFQNFASYINTIEKNLSEISKRDPERIRSIKDRIEKNLTELVGKEKVDQNRFEQELIYYIEKLDIAEEKVRLASHLSFFREALASNESNGKKLSFIAQEIGREINTIGSKANDAVVQRMVVDMKEELEKIKEQLLNIL